MNVNKEHFRNILLFYFRRGKNAAESYRDICDVYGEEAITHSTCKNWFKRFRSGEFSLEDAPRSGRPSEIESDEIMAMITNDRHLTTQEIADRFNVTRQTVGAKLHKLGLVKKSRYMGAPQINREK